MTKALAKYEMPVVRIRLELKPWRCDCGAVSAQWIEECPHCERPRPKSKTAKRLGGEKG